MFEDRKLNRRSNNKKDDFFTVNEQLLWLHMEITLSVWRQRLWTKLLWTWEGRVDKVRRVRSHAMWEVTAQGVEGLAEVKGQTLRNVSYLEKPRDKRREREAERGNFPSGSYDLTQERCCYLVQVSVWGLETRDLVDMCVLCVCTWTGLCLEVGCVSLYSAGGCVSGL